MYGKILIAVDKDIIDSLDVALSSLLCPEPPEPLHLLLRPAEIQMGAEDEEEIPADTEMLGIPSNLPIFRGEPLMPPLDVTSVPPQTPLFLDALFLAMEKAGYPKSLTFMPPLPPERPPGLSL